MDVKSAFKTNKDSWNKKTLIHYESDFYDKSAFAKARNSLNSYELKALKNISGKSLLHLQCHFGQDSLSWAAKGAQVTAVDISDEAIKLARRLSHDLNIPANFVCCNVLDTSLHIQETFNYVFTSYGTIGWLPDLQPWAQMISERLQPGGSFYIVDFHPIAWMYEYIDGKNTLTYHYNQKEAIYEEIKGSYADQDADFIFKEYGWNHSLSSVIQSLLDAGLTLTYFAEHDGSPYNVFPDMKQHDDGFYYLNNQKYPLIFEVMAHKPL